MIIDAHDEYKRRRSPRYKGQLAQLPRLPAGNHRGVLMFSEEETRAYFVGKRDSLINYGVCNSPSLRMYLKHVRLNEGGLPLGLPLNPVAHYNHGGSTEETFSRITGIPWRVRSKAFSTTYDDLKDAVGKQRFGSYAMLVRFIKKNLPLDFSRYPRDIYKKEWQSSDFIGKVEYKTVEETQAVVIAGDIRCISEYERFYDDLLDKMGLRRNLRKLLKENKTQPKDFFGPKYRTRRRPATTRKKSVVTIQELQDTLLAYDLCNGVEYRQWFREMRALSPVLVERYYSELNYYRDASGKAIPKAILFAGRHLTKRQKMFKSYTEGRRFMIASDINTQAEYHKARREGYLPEGMPSNPNATYKNEGWVSWADFLRGEAKVPLLLFAEAREWIKANDISTASEFKKASKERRLPKGMPSNPSREYNGKGWISWVDFLPLKPELLLHFEEARNIMIASDINTQAEYRKARREGRLPKGIPSAPDNKYDGWGWTSWSDFLRGEKRRMLLPLRDAREVMRARDISTATEFKKASREGRLPEGIPTNPAQKYMHDGWVSWPDFLGKRTPALAASIKPLIAKTSNNPPQYGKASNVSRFGDPHSAMR